MSKSTLEEFFNLVGNPTDTGLVDSARANLLLDQKRQSVRVASAAKQQEIRGELPTNLSYEEFYTVNPTATDSQYRDYRIKQLGDEQTQADFSIGKGLANATPEAVRILATFKPTMAHALLSGVANPTSMTESITDLGVEAAGFTARLSGSDLLMDTAAKLKRGDYTPNQYEQAYLDAENNPNLVKRPDGNYESKLTGDLLFPNLQAKEDFYERVPENLTDIVKNPTNFAQGLLRNTASEVGEVLGSALNAIKGITESVRPYQEEKEASAEISKKNIESYKEAFHKDSTATGSEYLGELYDRASNAISSTGSGELVTSATESLAHTVNAIRAGKQVANRRAEELKNKADKNFTDAENLAKSNAAITQQSYADDLAKLKAERKELAAKKKEGTLKKEEVDALKGKVSSLKEARDMVYGSASTYKEAMKAAKTARDKEVGEIGGKVAATTATALNVNVGLTEAGSNTSEIYAQTINTPTAVLDKYSKPWQEGKAERDQDIADLVENRGLTQEEATSLVEARAKRDLGMRAAGDVAGSSFVVGALANKLLGSFTEKFGTAFTLAKKPKGEVANLTKKEIAAKYLSEVSKRAGMVGVAAVGEGAEEFVQSAQGAYSTNKATQEYLDERVDPAKGVFEQGVIGSVTGSLSASALTSTGNVLEMAAENETLRKVGQGIADAGKAYVDSYNASGEKAKESSAAKGINKVNTAKAETLSGKDAVKKMFDDATTITEKQSTVMALKAKIAELDKADEAELAKTSQGQDEVTSVEETPTTELSNAAKQRQVERENLTNLITKAEEDITTSLNKYPDAAKKRVNDLVTAIQANKSAAAVSELSPKDTLSVVNEIVVNPTGEHSADLSKALQGSAHLTPTQKDYILKLVDKAASEKSGLGKNAEIVTQEIVHGGKGFIGLMEYVKVVNAAITEGDQESALYALRLLKGFKNSRVYKKDAAGEATYVDDTTAIRETYKFVEDNIKLAFPDAKSAIEALSKPQSATKQMRAALGTASTKDTTDRHTRSLGSRKKILTSVADALKLGKKANDVQAKAIEEIGSYLVQELNIPLQELEGALAAVEDYEQNRKAGKKVAKATPELKKASNIVAKAYLRLAKEKNIEKFLANFNDEAAVADIMLDPSIRRLEPQKPSYKRGHVAQPTLEKRTSSESDAMYETMYTSVESTVNELLANDHTASAYEETSLTFGSLPKSVDWSTEGYADKYNALVKIYNELEPENADVLAGTGETKGKGLTPFNRTFLNTIEEIAPNSPIVDRVHYAASSIGLLQTEENLFELLADTEGELYQHTISTLSEEDKADLDALVSYVNYFNTALSKTMVKDKDKTGTAKSGTKIERAENALIYEFIQDGAMDSNLSSAAAIALAQWFMNSGVASAKDYLSDEAIGILLNVPNPENHVASRTERKLLEGAGMVATFIAQTVGAAAVKTAGIKFDSSKLEQQLVTSLGSLIVAAGINAGRNGILEQGFVHTFKFNTAKKDAKPVWVYFKAYSTDHTGSLVDSNKNPTELGQKILAANVRGLNKSTLINKGVLKEGASIPTVKAVKNFKQPENGKILLQTRIEEAIRGVKNNNLIRDVLGASSGIQDVYTDNETIQPLVNPDGTLNTDNPRTEGISLSMARAIDAYNKHVYLPLKERFKAVKELPMDILELLFDDLPEAGTEHINHRERNAGIRADMITELDTITDIFNKVEKDKSEGIRLANTAAKNLRLGQEAPSNVTIQDSKMLRFLMVLKKAFVEINPTNRQHMLAYKLAVAEALDVDFESLTGGPAGSQDKMTPADIEAFFEKTVLGDVTINKAVEAIRERNRTGKWSAEGLVNLKKALTGKGIKARNATAGKMHKFAGLEALAAYDPKSNKPFKTSLTKENDGVTNGIGIALNQLATANSWEDFQDKLAKTGTFIVKKQEDGSVGTDYTSFPEYRADGNKDSYQAFGKRMGEVIQNPVENPLQGENASSALPAVNLDYALFNNTFGLLPPKGTWSNAAIREVKGKNYVSRTFKTEDGTKYQANYNTKDGKLVEYTKYNSSTGKYEKVSLPKGVPAAPATDSVVAGSTHVDGMIDVPAPLSKGEENTINRVEYRGKKGNQKAYANITLAEFHQMARAANFFLNFKLGAIVADAVIEFSRNFAKNPLMIFNYGAAIKGLKLSVINQIVEGIENAIALANADAMFRESEFKKIEEQVNKLSFIPRKVWDAEKEAYSNKTWEFKIDRKNPLATEVAYIVADEAAVAVEFTIGPAMEKVFDEQFGKHRAAIGKVIAASRLATMVFKSLYDTAVAKALKGKPEGSFLTKEEEQAIKDELKAFEPRISTAMSDEHGGDIWLPKGENTPNRDDAGKPLTKADNVKTPIMKDGKPSSVTGITYGNNIKDPSVSAAALITQGIDASVMYKLMELGLPFTNIFDAVIVPILEQENTTKATNKAYRDVHDSYSYVEAAYAMLKAIMAHEDATPELFGNLLEQVKGMDKLLEELGLDGDTEVSKESILQAFGEFNAEIQHNRNLLKKVGMLDNQYNGAPATRNGEALTDKELKEQYRVAEASGAATVLKKMFYSYLNRLDKKSARYKYVLKDINKIIMATKYIGEGRDASSTDYYRKMFTATNVANLSNLKDKDGNIVEHAYEESDLVFISANSMVSDKDFAPMNYEYADTTNEDGSPEIDITPRGVYKLIDEAAAVGASFITDLWGSIDNRGANSTASTKGDMMIVDYLTAIGYVPRVVNSKAIWSPAERFDDATNKANEEAFLTTSVTKDVISLPWDYVVNDPMNPTDYVAPVVTESVNEEGATSVTNGTFAEEDFNRDDQSDDAFLLALDEALYADENLMERQEWAEENALTVINGMIKDYAKDATAKTTTKAKRKQSDYRKITSAQAFNAAKKKGLKITTYSKKSRKYVTVSTGTFLAGKTYYVAKATAASATKATTKEVSPIVKAFDKLFESIANWYGEDLGMLNVLDTIKNAFGGSPNRIPQIVSHATQSAWIKYSMKKSNLLGADKFANGVYEHKGDTRGIIHIFDWKVSSSEERANTLVHELDHAASTEALIAQSILGNPSNSYKGLVKLLNDLEPEIKNEFGESSAVYKGIYNSKSKDNASLDTALKIGELLAWGKTDPDLRYFLETLDINLVKFAKGIKKNSDKSLWKRIMTFAERILGINGEESVSAYEALIGLSAPIYNYSKANMVKESQIEFLNQYKPKGNSKAPKATMDAVVSQLLTAISKDNASTLESEIAARTERWKNNNRSEEYAEAYRLLLQAYKKSEFGTGLSKSVELYQYSNDAAEAFANNNSESSQIELMSIFDELVDIGTVKETPEHTEHLRGLLGTISPWIADLKVEYTRSTRGVSKGSQQDNIAKLRINTGLKSSNLEQSAIELMVHELLHPMLIKLEAAQPKIYAMFRKEYEIAKANLTEEDFLGELVNPTEYDRIIAKERYMHTIHNSTAGGVAYETYLGEQGQYDNADPVKEFAVAAATNSHLMAALSRMERRLPKEKRSLTRKIVDAFAELMQFIRDRRWKLDNQRTDVRMTQLINLIAKVEQDNVNKVYNAIKKTESFAEKLVDKTNTKGKDLFNTYVLDTRGIQALGKIAQLDKYKEGLRQYMGKTALWQNSVIPELANEFFSARAGLAPLVKLLTKSSHFLERETVRVMEGVAKSVQLQMGNLDEAENQHIYTSVFEADLAALTLTHNMDEVFLLATDASVRATRIDKLTTELQQVAKGAAYWMGFHAKDVGYHLVTQQRLNESGAFVNAYQIAQMDTLQESVRKLLGKSEREDAEAIVNELITLHAINFNISENQLNVGDMFGGKAKFNLEQLENLLVLHRGIQETALEMSFQNNPRSFRKGYLREMYDANLDVMMVTLTEGNGLKNLGYVNKGRVETDANMVGDPLYYFVREGRGREPWLTGIMALDNPQQRGFDIFGGNKNLSELDKLKGELHMQRMLASNTRNQMDIYNHKSHAAKWLPKGRRGSVSQPTFNEKGEITGYRVITSRYIKDRVLKRNKDFSRSLGATLAGISRKHHAVINNEALFEKLHEIYEKEYTQYPHEFIKITPDNRYSDFWNLIPERAKEVVRDKWGEKAVYVRKEHMNIAFGYRKFSVTQLEKINEPVDGLMNKILKELNNAFVFLLRNKIAGVTGQYWTAFVTTMKDTIVIRSGVVTAFNIMSNIALLWLSGVPLSTAITEHFDAYINTFRYNAGKEALLHLDLKLANPNLDSNTRTKLKAERAKVRHELYANPVRELIEAGLYQSIVSDVDTTESHTPARDAIEEFFDPVTKRIPDLVKTPTKWLLMTHDSSSYQFMRDMAQTSDFAARAILHKHNIANKQMSFADSVHDVMMTFISYDIPQHKGLQYLNDMGAMGFTKYLFRIQQVLLKRFGENPTRVIMLALFNQYIAQIPSPYDAIMSFDNILKRFFSPDDWFNMADESLFFQLAGEVTDVVR